MLLKFLLQLAFAHFSIAATTDFISETQHSKWISICSEFRQMKLQSSNFRHLSRIGEKFEIFMNNVEIFFSDNHLAGIASLENHSNDFGLVYFFLPFVSFERMHRWEYYQLPYLFETDSKDEQDVLSRKDVMSRVISYMDSIRELDALRILIRICKRLLYNDHFIYDKPFLDEAHKEQKINLLRLQYESYLGASSTKIIPNFYYRISYLVKLKDRHPLLLEHLIHGLKKHIANYFSLYSNLDLQFLLDEDPRLIVVILNCMRAKLMDNLAIFNAFFGHPKDSAAMLKYTEKAQKILKEQLDLVETSKWYRDPKYLKSLIKKVNLFSGNIK
jgi:hypothetical protein